MTNQTKNSLYKKLPTELHPIIELAYNLWWSWQPDLRYLIRQFDQPLWNSTTHNIIEMLRKVSKTRLDQLKKDEKYISNLNDSYNKFKDAVNRDNSWFNKNYPEFREKHIAYLSMEYGIHNSVRIYSGGLGILAGDHLKESSDLGIPLTAVGFLYQEGYFTQEIPIDGWQKAHYREADFSSLPINEVADPDNPEKDLIISIDFNDIIVKVKVWLLCVGSVNLYLMDSNIDDNPPWDRNLTDRLYGGSQELRLKQEKILGIGAVRLFKKLKIHPSMYHLNEGHCSFSSLERIKNLMDEGKSFDDAVNNVRNNTLFTTHTPVPAGHDVFPFSLIETYFDKIYLKSIGRENLLSLGSYKIGNNQEGFNMTALGIRTAKYVNGVSKLHRDVSFKMFEPLWKEMEQKYGNDFQELLHITNGVHVPSFATENVQELLSTIAPNWIENHDSPSYWIETLSNLSALSDEAIWKAHSLSKSNMMRYFREKARRKLRRGEWSEKMAFINGILLDPNALTIGFARRFATYKRATLIFKNLERIKKLLQDEYKPLQIVFAGKAHPADDPGKKLIQDIVNFAKDNNLSHRIAFIEDYGLSIGKSLLQGVDIWLNNPLRPYEASGTSGMKASCNFVPNCSILDGWWNEGYNGKNGWAINPSNKQFDNLVDQNEFDANSLYEILESEIIDKYYDRDESGMPTEFIKIMRESLISVLPNFSSRRMLKEYISKIYSKIIPD